MIIQKVVTSGGAIIDAVSQLRELGATIEQAVCVIDRESLGAENLTKIGVKLMPLFTKSYLQSSSC
ncbi:MAG: hypothetical protein RLZZ574_287 [Cyanobacteriota bacterium]|jgi:orotate phosphoribosyltransferase